MTHNTLDLGHLAPPPHVPAGEQRDELADVTHERDQLRRHVRALQDELQEYVSRDSVAAARKATRGHRYDLLAWAIAVAIFLAGLAWLALAIGRTLG